MPGSVELVVLRGVCRVFRPYPLSSVPPKSRKTDECFSAQFLGCFFFLEIYYLPSFLENRHLFFPRPATADGLPGLDVLSTELLSRRATPAEDVLKMPSKLPLCIPDPAQVGGWVTGDRPTFRKTFTSNRRVFCQRDHVRREGRGEDVRGKGSRIKIRYLFLRNLRTL